MIDQPKYNEIRRNMKRETQPAPKPNGNQPIVDLVMMDILARKVAGVKKYGTPLQANNGRDALQDAYEEALDLAIYLRQAIEERRGCKNDKPDPELIVKSLYCRPSKAGYCTDPEEG